MNFFQPWAILSMSHAFFSGSTFDSGARLPFRKKKIRNRSLQIRVINMPKIVSIIIVLILHLLYYLNDKRFCVKINEKKRERSLVKLVLFFVIFTNFSCFMTFHILLFIFLKFNFVSFTNIVATLKKGFQTIMQILRMVSDLIIV